MAMISETGSFLLIQKYLFIVERIISSSLREDSVEFNSGGTESGSVLVKRLILSKQLGLVIQNKEQVKKTDRKATADGAEAISLTVIPADAFNEIPALFTSIKQYIFNRPRLITLEKNIVGFSKPESVISIMSDVSSELVKKPRDSKRGIVGTIGQLVPEKIEVEEMNLFIFDFFILFDAEGDYIKTKMLELDRTNGSTALTAKDVLWQQSTIQGRCYDLAIYAAMVLAMNGYNSGILSDRMIHTKTQRNGIPTYTQLSQIHFNKGAFKDCEAYLRLEPEKLGCSIKSAKYGEITTSQEDKAVGAKDMIDAVVSISSIINMKPYIDMFSSYVRKVKNKKGLVYLQDTAVEEILSVFYPHTPGELDGNVILGCYIDSQTAIVGHSNPKLSLKPITKQQPDETSSAFICRLGVQTNTYQFYMIPSHVEISEEVLVELSNVATVYICREFGTLDGFHTMLQSYKNPNTIIDRLLMLGGIFNKEALLVNNYVKQLLREHNTDVLKQIPLLLGKEDSNGELIQYTDILGTLIKHNTGVNSLLLTDKIQVVNNGIIEMAESPITNLTQGELRRLYMALTDENPLKKIDEKGIYNTVIYCKIKVNSSIKNLPFKLIMSRMDNKGNLKLELFSLVIANGVSPQAMKFMNTGIHLVCGEPSSGKHATFRDICCAVGTVYGNKKVLVLDTTCTLVKESFVGNTTKNIDITICRSTDINYIKGLLAIKPDVIIVNKINLYDEELLSYLVDVYSSSQNLIISIDMLFIDFIQRYRGEYLYKFNKYLQLVTDQIRITSKINDTDSALNLGAKTARKEQKFVLQVMQQMLDVNVLRNITFTVDNCSMSHNYDGVKEFYLSNPSSILKQLDSLLANNSITIEEVEKYKNELIGIPDKS